jgi:hypothetical protein
VCRPLLQATSLRHPFIVPCVESWVVQNHTVNMIYNFCQNGDLSSYLTKIRKQVEFDRQLPALTALRQPPCQKSCASVKL